MKLCCFWFSIAFLVLTIICTNLVNGACQHGSLTPNPANCSTYIQCDNGKAVIRPCPTGLKFNPLNSVCDWPQNVNCQNPNIPSIECYSCSYVQLNVNLTNEGCEKSPTPSKYKRSDCYGFGNLQVAGAVRHSTNVAHSADPACPPPPAPCQITGQRAYDAQNTHCVKISGKADSGSLVVLRGCENLYETNETFTKWKCFTKKDYDFVLPGTGMIRNVEKCYCKGSACNASSSLNLSSILGLLTLFIMFCYNALTYK